MGGSVRLGAIFNNLQSMRAGELQDRVHVAWPPGKVHHDNGLSTGREHAADGVSRQVLAVCIDVGDYRTGAHRYGTTRRSHKGSTGSYDLVSRPYVQSAEGRFQGHRSVRQCDRVPTPCESGELAFELT